MSAHRTLDDALRERAALFALGALEPGEMAECHAHLGAGCEVCRAAVESYASVATDLALAVSPALPSPATRDRVLAEGGLHFVPAGAGEWIDAAPGVRCKALAGGTSQPSRSRLVWLAPGTVLPRHVHAGTEHSLVLEGDFEVAGHLLSTGDYHVAAPGSVHEGNRTRGGCLLLVIDVAAPLG